MGVISINGRNPQAFLKEHFYLDYKERRFNETWRDWCKNKKKRTAPTTLPIQLLFFALYIHYLRIFAWSHECFAKVKSSSSTNLCLIPSKALTVLEALSDASIKIMFFSPFSVCYRQNFWHQLGETVNATCKWPKYCELNMTRNMQWSMLSYAAIL